MLKVKRFVGRNVFATAEGYKIAANTCRVHKRMSMRAVSGDNRVFTRNEGSAPGTVIGFLVVVLLRLHVQEHKGNYTGYSLPTKGIRRALNRLVGRAAPTVMLVCATGTTRPRMLIPIRSQGGKVVESQAAPNRFALSTVLCGADLRKQVRASSS